MHTTLVTLSTVLLTTNRNSLFISSDKKMLKIIDLLYLIRKNIYKYINLSKIE